jgi:hypothetical protein
MKDFLNTMGLIFSFLGSLALARGFFISKGDKIRGFSLVWRNQ